MNFKEIEQNLDQDLHIALDHHKSGLLTEAENL